MHTLLTVRSHIKINCKNEAYCVLCDGSGHEARDCPRAKRQRNKDKPTADDALPYGTTLDEDLLEKILQIMILRSRE
jgi:hypothetical protein